MTLEARLAGTSVPGRSSDLAGQVQAKGQTNTSPRPPGWGLGVGPTSPP